MKPDDKNHPLNISYIKILIQNKLPSSESLKDTLIRVKPLLNQILPKIEEGFNVLVVAHGNSLRAILK